MSLVHSHELDLSGEQYPYLILQPGHYPARTGACFQSIIDNEFTLMMALGPAAHSPLLAVDLETRGSEIALEQIDIVGIGLAWATGSCYLPYEQFSPEMQQAILDVIYSHPRTVAHNVSFDAGVLHQITGRMPENMRCSYSLLAHLANEGYVGGPGWGLKSAMEKLLGWESSNEDGLDEWLVRNGWYIGPRKADDGPEDLVRKWKSGAGRPDKSQMWRAPVEILGAYCVLDAEATYLLYSQVLEPCAAHFPGLQEHEDRFLRMTRLHIEQKQLGIEVDREGLSHRREQVTSSIVALRSAILTMPQVVPHVKSLEAEMLQPLLDREPARYIKSGRESKNWAKWLEQLHKAESGEDPEYRFNLASDRQLRKLLYQCLGFQVRVRTEAGEPATSIKALRHMGEIGSQLVELNYLEKEFSYLDDYAERVESRSTIHPSFRMPGTTTGRLSCKGPNLQQISKTNAMMSLFRAAPGRVWVDIDFAALESVVAAEFSQDPNLLALYADNVPENDIHLFLSAATPGPISQAVLATGYTPDNPPPGSVARAKKECKRERNISKTTVYACIAENTRVRVRRRGLVVIQGIKYGDQIWDGNSWVETAGAIDKGIRVCNNLEQVWLTEDHRILDDKGMWHETREYRKVCEGTKSPQPFRPKKPSASWSEVWQVVRDIIRGKNSGRL